MANGQAHYREIAADLARRMVAGEWEEGARLYARSDLPNTYGVSRETVRRGAALLNRWGAVQVSAGGGIKVVSARAAQRFLAALESEEKLRQALGRLRCLVQSRRQLDEEITGALDQVLKLAEGHFEPGRAAEE